MYQVRRSQDYLEHHGVLGMKWGIRRYQPYSTVPRGSGKGGKEIGEANSHKKMNKHYGIGSTSIVDPFSARKVSDKELETINKRYINEKIYNKARKEKIARYAKIAGCTLGVAALSVGAVYGYKYLQANPRILQQSVKSAIKKEMVNSGKEFVDSISDSMKQTRINAAQSEFAKSYVNNPAVKVIGTVGDSITGRRPVRANLAKSNFARSYVNNPAVRAIGRAGDAITGRGIRVRRY